MPLGLVALAVAAFGIGLTEFAIMGLLPEIATDLAISETTAGWLVTGYALGVVIGALFLSSLLERVPPKTALLGSMALYLVGNVVSATSDDFSIMLGSRVVAALCQGVFFSIGSVVAANMVDASRRTKAVAIMFLGITAANVFGVPLGTFVGQTWGWRTAFWVIVVVGVVAALGIMALVRPTAVSSQVVPRRQQLAIFRHPQVVSSLAISVLGFGGMFGGFTYIAFTLTEVTGYSSGAVPWLLVVFGLGLVVGNTVASRFGDRDLDGTILVLLSGLVVTLVVFALTVQSQVASAICLFAMGGFAFGLIPTMQVRIVRWAPSAPTLASGANIAAFNFGNAVGAWIAGIAIAVGLGYTSTLWVGVVLSGAALLIMLTQRGRTTSPDDRARVEGDEVVNAAG
ncbi:MFS transporter [Nocardioides bruguierae]|uniref:MFS transporter n=1 Tax=Nocardioides bruguierae TaxID=2945102 RepID=UPI002021C88D|nr:MFS transporter [Nocardioides bruguierae]MCL8026901.1 MFS transporter [Nocardioides bruguierae]